MQPVTRPEREPDLDGHRELTFGLLMISTSLTLGMALGSPKGSVGRYSYLLNLVFSFAIVWWPRAHRAPDTRISSHIQPDAKVSSVPLLLMAGLTPIIAWLRYPESFDWSAALLGLTMAAVYWYKIARRVSWKSIIALILTASTIAIAALPFTSPHLAGNLLRPLVISGLFGILTSLSGGITLRQYLQEPQ